MELNELLAIIGALYVEKIISQKQVVNLQAQIETLKKALEPEEEKSNKEDSVGG